MNRYRWLLLLVGPLPIVAVSLGISRWVRGAASAQEPAPNRALVAADRLPSRPTELPIAALLQRSCRDRAERLRDQLGGACRAIERPPLVLAGDLSDERLAAWYDGTIGPAMRAMSRSYFRTRPDHVVTVMLFASEQSYQHYAQSLYGEQNVSVYGYYKPNLRTLIMNIDTGGGTLVHELTHALVDFDFPQIPDWFNEGLASLHEQCRIRDDESGIDGLTNWRLSGLQQVMRAGRLRSLKELIADRNFRGADVGLNYAHARYLCLFLQRKDLLREYYVRFRDSYATDPSGAATLLACFPDRSWSELDQDFQRWALELTSEP